MMTHRAKLRRLAFIACPCPAIRRSPDGLHWWPRIVAASRPGLQECRRHTVACQEKGPADQRRQATYSRYQYRYFVKRLLPALAAVRRAGARSTTSRPPASVTDAPAKVRRSRERDCRSAW